MSEHEHPPGPALRVVRGAPEPDELAALVAVVLGSAPTAAAPSAARTSWASPAALVRRPLRSGPGAWVASGQPGR